MDCMGDLGQCSGNAASKVAVSEWEWPRQSRESSSTQVAETSSRTAGVRVGSCKLVGLRHVRTYDDVAKGGRVLKDVVGVNISSVIEVPRMVTIIVCGMDDGGSGSRGGKSERENVTWFGLHVQLVVGKMIFFPTTNAHDVYFFLKSC
jgi:hypothetical protein